MNPEAQRVAIAEASGFVHFQQGETVLLGWKTVGLNEEQGQIIPDYLSDLNALHSAAKATCEKRGWEYSVRYSAGCYYCVIYQTSGWCGAAQNPSQCAALAESLLRAMNLWIE